MSNGPDWYRTGEPPHFTVVPFVVAEEYHGFLLNGKLVRVG